MKREIKFTEDGSVTIYLPEWEETYHSKHGAIQEANHVFIKNGLEIALNKINNHELSVLEIGFGTGLNACMTWNEAINKKLKIKYTTLEAFPVLQDEIDQLNYPSQLNFPTSKFLELHQSNWDERVNLDEHFTFLKKQIKFQDYQDIPQFDLIYFDAFGFAVQPELWSEQIFQNMYNVLKEKGILTTYACRNPIKRAMEVVGFDVYKVPGPPGKREMLIAYK